MLYVFQAGGIEVDVLYSHMNVCALNYGQNVDSSFGYAAHFGKNVGGISRYIARCRHDFCL
jgi:hypothetical protein